MDNLFLIIFLLTPLALIAGLIKPELFKDVFGGNAPKKSLLLKIFISMLVGSFVAFGITSDAKTSNKKSSQAEGEIISQITEEKPPSPELPDAVVSDISEEELEPENIYIVTSVADGDTVTLNNGWKVRYIGIDTPEIKHPTKPKGCLADEAKARNEDLVLNKEVILEKDVSDFDIYDRHLAYVYANGEMVNLTLIKEGLAESSEYPPDTKNQQLFDEAETKAREQKLGIWSSACQELLTSPSNSQFTCNCSKACGSMASCEEAYFQLNTCGCSARDGDEDGVPCESLCR